MLEGSLRCFAYGLLGLLPVIGLPFAIAALVISGKARVHENRLWNAARSYRLIGVVCAAAGTIFWFCVISLLIYNSVVNSNGPDNYSSGD